MREKDCKVGVRVIVIEFNATGTIFESGMSDSGLDRIYGVQFDKTVFPRDRGVNFVPTTVWHCKAKDLEPG